MRTSERTGGVSPRAFAATRRRCAGYRRRRHLRAWMLLETVIATGLLILGLGVIGAQVQDADTSIRKMQLRLRAMILAEATLAELDLGLVELDTIDEEQEEEFGPRYPDFGWRLTTEETAIEEMFLLKLEVLYLPCAPEDCENYQEGDFDFEDAETLFTVYAMRATPRPMNLGEEFGMEEEEFLEISEKLSELGIQGLDAEALDPTILAKVDMEELLTILPLLADVFGIDITNLMGVLPPELADVLKEGGLLGEEGEEEAGDEEPQP